MTQKRPVYNGYTEYYMNGKEIREYFKNCYSCSGKHHSVVSNYPIYFAKSKIKDDILYRLFINNSFCLILDNETDEKITFFGYERK